MEAEAILVITVVMLIFLIAFIYFLFKAYNTSKDSTRLIITNAFFATSLIFVTSKLYEMTNEIYNNGLIPTIKILMGPDLSTTDICIGFFLLLSCLSLLIVNILLSVLMNTIALYTNKTQFDKPDPKYSNKWYTRLIINNPKFASGFAIILSLIVMLRVLQI